MRFFEKLAVAYFFGPPCIIDTREGYPCVRPTESKKHLFT